MIELVDATSDEQVRAVRELFVEYAESLGFDLSFQDYDKELATLPGEYRAPRGMLLLASCKGEVAGCAALRPIDDAICEMKRMYVRPRYRGLGIGRTMAIKIIEFARAAGYERMRLDTIDTMTEAIALYRSLGFTEIQPYRHNPIPGAKYMELVLR